MRYATIPRQLLDVRGKLSQNGLLTICTIYKQLWLLKILILLSFRGAHVRWGDRRKPHIFRGDSEAIFIISIFVSCISWPFLSQPLLKSTCFAGRGRHKPRNWSWVRAQSKEEEEGAEDAFLPQEEEEGQEGEGREEEGEDPGLSSPPRDNINSRFSQFSRKVQTFWVRQPQRHCQDCVNSSPPTCVSAPKASLRVCVCVCAQYTFLSLRTNTYTITHLCSPQSSVNMKREPCADILLEKLCFLCLSMKKLYCCCEWSIGCQRG